MIILTFPPGVLVVDGLPCFCCSPFSPAVENLDGLFFPSTYPSPCLLSPAADPLFLWYRMSHYVFSFRRFSFYRAVLQCSSKNSSRDLPNCPFSLLVIFSPLNTLELCSFSACYPLVLLMYLCWLNVLLFPFFFFLPRPSAGICDFFSFSSFTY